MGILSYALEQKPPVLSVWSPDDFVRSLDEPQREALHAALLGAGPEGLDALAEYLKANLINDAERRAIRERIWKIETDIVARFAPEVEAFIEREPKQVATGRIYATDQKRFERFCNSLGVPSLPASAGAVAAFILAEHDGGVKLKLIQRRISAIKAMHRSKGYLLPTDDRLVCVVMEHIKANQPKGTKDHA